jgi:hypothetical protein
MLFRRRTGAELASAGIINRAVKGEDLEPEVAELVSDPLARPPYASVGPNESSTRGSKHTNRSLDPSVANEMINFLQQRIGGVCLGPREIKNLGGKLRINADAYLLYR